LPRIKTACGYIGFIAALALLFTLSYWQFERLEWKTALIHNLEREYVQNPMDRLLTFDDLSAMVQQENPLIQASVIGQYLSGQDILLGPKTQDGIIGAHVITPFKMKQGYILVNRGFIAQTDAHHETLPLKTGVITIGGLLRKPDWNKFTPENSPENNIWTKPDIHQIAHTHNLSPVAPVMLYLDHQQIYPRNKHLHYALFWLSLGCIWFGFGAYFVFKRKKYHRSN